MKTCIPIIFAALALLLFMGARAHGQDPHARSSSDSRSATSGAGGSMMRYATKLDGDHSLDTATVAEQAFGTYVRYTVVRYTVRLEFASGHEQPLAITAPLGGLQPEMPDMSGDNIPNDLVLRSRLLRPPLVVLLNDGYDHLTVAVYPGHFTAGEGRVSGGQSPSRALALASARRRLLQSGHRQNKLGAEPSRTLVASLAPMLTQIAVCASDFGRAPPLRFAQT